MRRGSVFSGLIMCGGGMRSILLLCLVARCIETIDVCIWRIFAFMPVVRNCAGVCGNVCCITGVNKYELDKGTTSEVTKYLFRADNVW